MNKLSMSLIAGSTLLCSSLFAVDFVAPSSSAPGGLDSMKIPQLVVMGFDDNAYDDGVRWVVDSLLGGKMNPAGSGNKATYDGTPAVASFMIMSKADQKVAWRYAYEQGFEIGNHTKNHDDNPALDFSTYDQTIYEVGECSKYIINELGLAPSEIKGFRTPFLKRSIKPNGDDPANRTYLALKNLGIIYDGTEGVFPTSTSIYDEVYKLSFPWTMDSGHVLPFDQTFLNDPTPGLWEIPHVVFLKEGEERARMLGFETTMESSGQMTSEDAFFDYLKTTFDWHYGKFSKTLGWDGDGDGEKDVVHAGNRAPMNIGLHSDVYSLEAGLDPSTPQGNMSIDVHARRRAVTRFVDYVLTHEDARIVAFRDVLKWMQNPVELEDLSKNRFFEYSESTISENLLSFATISAAEGLGSTIEASDIVDGSITVSATIDNNENYVANRQADLIVTPGGTFENVDGITVTYKSKFPLRFTFEQSDLQASEASHFFSLPTADDFKTVTIPVNEYKVEKPYWSDAAAPFDLSKVTELAISPMASDTMKTESFTISNIQVFGSEQFGTGESSIEDQSALKGPKRLSVAGVYKNTMQLQIPVNGTYSVELFTPSGRKVFTETRNFSAGINSLGLSALSNGAYFVRMNGNGITVSDRFILQ